MTVTPIDVDIVAGIDISALPESIAFAIRDNITAYLKPGALPVGQPIYTALLAAMRYIRKAESDDGRRVKRKLYCIIAGSAVTKQSRLASSLYQV
jgi:hypothetical protein